MINITLGWREFLCTTSYLTLVTDLDYDAVKVIQEWAHHIQYRVNLSQSLKLSQIFSLLADLVEFIMQKCEVKAIYTTDYGDFVSTHNIFRNDRGLETIYIDFDKDAGAYFQVGTMRHFGPRTDVSGFMSLDPDLFKRNKYSKFNKEENSCNEIFEDTLDIME